MQINGGIWASNEEYYYTEPTIDAIKKLKRIPTIKHKLTALIRSHRTENDIAYKIKVTTPMFFPYEIIDTNAKLEAKNVESLEMLILDIDSGCTIESFIKLNPDFDYYLYSTVTHRVTGFDKFRVVIPLKKAMPIEEAIARKQAIIDRFSISGKTYLDESFLDRGRGFIIPVELEFFQEHESKAGLIFDLEVLPKTDFIPATKSQLALEGFTAQNGIPEIEKLVSLYKDSSEDCLIEVNQKTYSRNPAFFWIHVEIAKYRPTEVYQKQLAVIMNWDNCRNDVTKTVESARKCCKSINLSALNAKSDKYWSEVKTNDVEYLKVSDIEVHGGKKHLLTATTGTGKTTLFLDEKFAHKVIFAVPINIIGQQAHSQYGYPFFKGTKANTPTEDKLICSYNYLVELLRVGVPEDYIIVLDEFHRVVSDDFRTGTLSELVDLIGASQNTIFCLSGTFDPSLFNIFNFDHHYDFKAQRAVRQVQVWNATGALANALIHFIGGLSSDTNNLILFDDKNLLKEIKAALPHVNIVTKDDKDFVERLVNPNFLNGRVTGTILTTQVLMEGINIHDLDNIVVVAKKHYGKEQIVQFFERDRGLKAKCHIIRKPIKDSEVYIPDSDKEKEYQNQIFDEVINRIGISGMKLIGLKDSDKLLRMRQTEIYINCLYAPIKQKQAMDRANFKNLDLSQYGYELLGAKSLDGKPVKALIDVKRIGHEREQAKYESAIDSILSGLETPNFPELTDLIAQLKKQGIEQIREICLDKNEVQAYSERFSYFDERLEQEIYQTFGVGKLYSTKECKDFLANFVGQRSFARVRENNHIKVFRRYFHLTQIRSTSKREAGLELTKIRKVGNLEGSSDLSPKV
jgi:hypothetical protein